MIASPELITELQPNEVFVFGSNIEGKHYGGAAKIAVEKFGAIMGEGVGLNGNSYAIPTMGSLDDIKKHIDNFMNYAYSRADLIFLVTRIGCGIAGYTDKEIARLFLGNPIPYNVRLPQSFINALGGNW